MSDPNSNPDQSSPKGLEHAGVIDFLGFDQGRSEVLLVMSEQRPWLALDLQLFQLQEKLNAYLSFALDGEMHEAYPQFLGKKLRIRLECVEKPPEEAFEFLQHVYEQAALQGIIFEVDVLAHTCGCGQPSSECGNG